MCVKYRKMLLKPKECQETLQETLIGIAERYEYKMERIGTDGDHVHVFVGASGRWAPTAIMQGLKSICAKKILDLLHSKRKAKQIR